MLRRTYIPALLLAALAALAGFAGRASAQSATTAPHVIVVKLVETQGSKPYAFQPSTINAEPGDTLRFVDGSNMMHNVHFTSTPKGAHLGSAAAGPYLTATGQSYTIVVDSRFTDGKYELVCDPHQTLGMTATLVVSGAAKQTAAR